MDPDPAPDASRDDATLLLRRAAAGDAQDAERLLALLYDELHAMAGGYMAGERGDHTLQATALVHEAWIKLFDREGLDFQDRRHFLATAARAMRQILVDHARSKRRLKRGRGWQRVDPELEIAAIGPADPGVDGELDLVALDRALDALKAHSARQAQIVELRYFGGLPVEEVATVLDVSERTVVREWRFAKAWLTRELERE